LILAAYVAFEAAESLLKKEPPEASYVGIVVAALAVVPLIGKEGIEALRGEACGCGNGCSPSD
jgi:hypothetical protein